MQYKQTSNIICTILGSNQIKAKHCSNLTSVMPLFARDTDLKLIGHLTDYYFSPTV